MLVAVAVLLDKQQVDKAAQVDQAVEVMVASQVLHKRHQADGVQAVVEAVETTAVLVDLADQALLLLDTQSEEKAYEDSQRQRWQ
jgi:hypothetical protein